MSIDYRTIPIPKTKDFKARQAKAQIRRDEKAEKMNDPEYIAIEGARFHAKQEREKQEKVTIAREHHRMLTDKLASLQEKASLMEDKAFRAGEADMSMFAVKANIAALPGMIERAAREVQDAIDVVTEHQANTPRLRSLH